MPYVQASARSKTLAAAIVIALTAALALVGMAAPVRAVGPDTAFTIDLSSRPLGIAVNASGDLYVSQRYKPYVLVYPNGSTEPDPDMTLTGIEGVVPDEPQWATAIAFDSTGRPFVSSSDGTIYVFETGSTIPNETVLTGDPDDDKNSMALPLGLAFDSNDNLFVANTATNDDAVYVFASGNSLPDATKKIQDAALKGPQSVAVNAAGDVYIGGSGEDATVGVWVAPTGSTTIDPAQTKASLPDPRALGINDEGDLYAANGTSVAVYTLGATTPSNARTLTGIERAQGIAVVPDNVHEPEGTIYVADFAANKILRFSPEPVLTVDNANVKFGDVLVGTTTSETITVSNSAGADLIMDDTPFEVGGDNPNRFTVVETDCASVILVRNDNSCTVEVALEPSARGDKTADLKIRSSAPENPYIVPLSGRGIAPNFVPNPGLYAYGDVPVDAPAKAFQYTIQNSGDAPLVLPSSSVSITGTDPGPFQITENTCSDTSLNPEATCTVTVGFDPIVAGLHTANLQFVPLAPETTRTIEMTGSGIVPAFTSSDSSKEFTTTVGYPASEVTFTITSDGSQELVFSAEGVNLAGINTAHFHVSTDTCSGTTVSVSETCDVGIQFAPNTVGNKSAELTFANNAPDSPQSITLLGYSLPAAPEVSLSQAGKDFADFTIGSSAPSSHSFTVTNTGTATLNVSSMQLIGQDLDAFSVQPSSTCADGSVAVASSCVVIVQFAPGSIGDKRASLRLVTDAPGSPDTLPLTGTAISLASPPGRPTAASGANGQAALSWPTPSSDGNQNISGYRVQVSMTPTTGFANASGGCATAPTRTASSCTATGLANGTPYYFRVATINGVGTSEYSVVSPATIPAAATPPAVIPPSLIQPQTLAKCNLASGLKKRGRTKLQKGACLTNAGQRVIIKVTFRGKGKKKTKVKQSPTKIKVKAKGYPLKVILRLSAQSVPGFTSYRGKVKYKAK